MRNFLKNLKNKILKVSKSQSLMQIFDGVWCPEASCTAVGTYSPRVLSRITRTLPAFTLVVLMLVMGGFSVRACGATSSVNTAALWTANTYDAGDSVVWTAPNVTFKLHNGGNIELYMSDHILIQKNQHYTLEWRVASGYTIQVTQVSVRARSTLQSYITVGSNKSGNIIGSSYTTVNSQALNLGNSGSVDIYPESSRDDAIVHMDEITVTYTFSGLTYTVRFNANLDGASGSMSNQSFSFDESKALTANGLSYDLKAILNGNTLRIHMTLSPLGYDFSSIQQDYLGLAICAICLVKYLMSFF